MNMPRYGSWLYRNLPNTASLLGVLPLALLFLEDGIRFLVPLLIFNNIMDDLDGQLAVKLNLRSAFGATLDNICDAAAHVIFVMVVGTSNGHLCTAFALLAAAAILIRSVSRIVAPPGASTGSATNELMRHIIFVFAASSFLEWDPQPWLLGAFALNTFSMLAPYRLPHLIRSLTTSATGIAMVNVSLLVAWYLTNLAPAIALCFWVPYLYSLISGGVARLRNSST